MNQPIKLPCLRGRMGDWIYYVSLLKFQELSSRTSLVPEIHKNIELSRWIQREVSDRCEEIVQYLKDQPQRFFNSIICGIYGGKPQWQELDINAGDTKLTEEETEYLGKTFGILTLDGNEKIFAIDGQHRTNAIKMYLKNEDDIKDEEVAVIFIAHKNSKEGEVRTRRLFSTLNRYAVPVSISEIIALDEEDNSAILTRWLMEDFDFLKDKFQFSKTRSMNLGNKTHFSNIVLLYDIVTIILTDKSFTKNVKLSGYDQKSFTTRRQSEKILNKEFEKLKSYFKRTLSYIPSVNSFFETGILDRKSNNSTLIFRPIGQIIFFYVLKIAKEHRKEDKALDYFKKDTFHLGNKIWKKVFLDSQSKTIKTDKPRQFLTIQLICKKIGIKLAMTKAEKELMENFKINIKDV